MFGRFMPREVKFFDLFNALIKEVVHGADELVAVMTSLSESHEKALIHAANLDRFEEQADKIADETMAMLHSTFITPLDREEIHQLIKHLDSIIDTMQDVAGMVVTYDVRQATPEAIRFANIIRASVIDLEKGVNLLSNMKNGPAIIDACREVSNYESQADKVLRDAISKLFREEQDVRELIKLKAVYELLETITDDCKHTATLLEAIVLENS